jgi:hypothetical protein
VTPSSGHVETPACCWDQQKLPASPELALRHVLKNSLPLQTAKPLKQKGSWSIFRWAFGFQYTFCLRSIAFDPQVQSTNGGTSVLQLAVIGVSWWLAQRLRWRLRGDSCPDLRLTQKQKNPQASDA